MVSSEPLRTFLEVDKYIAMSRCRNVAMSQMLSDQQPNELSVSSTRQIVFWALGLRWLAAILISDPNSARLAVTKTKDISCDGASLLLSRVKNCCHHVSAVSLV